MFQIKPSMALTMIARFGTKEMKEKYLTPFCPDVCTDSPNERINIRQDRFLPSKASTNEERQKREKALENIAKDLVFDNLFSTHICYYMTCEAMDSVV